MLFEELLLRLHELCFLLLALYDLIQLFLELYLELLYSLLVFALHFGHNALIHGDEFVERTFDSIFFLLEIVDLVSKLGVGGLQFPIFAEFLLQLLEIVCLFEKNMISKFAWSVGKLTVCSLPIFFWLQLIQKLCRLFLVLAT